MLNKDRVAYLYLALGIVQAAHSVEEMINGLWKYMPGFSAALHSQFHFFPVMSMSALSFDTLNLILVAAMLAFSPFPFRHKGWVHKIVIIIAIIEVINSLIPISAVLILQSYFPGCISAIFMLLLSLLLLMPKRKSNGHQSI